jgi:hypothetical protein
MLAKCLNPACSAVFRYLSDGRIFHLEIPVAGDTSTSRRREYFWLCDSCCARFTVVLKNGTGEVQSRFVEMISGERLEQRGERLERGEEDEPFLNRPGSNVFGT